MRVELLSVCQIIRKVITEIVLISWHITVIKWLQNILLAFLYYIILYVNESIVPFSAWIWTYRSTTHNIFCISQIVEKKA